MKKLKRGFQPQVDLGDLFVTEVARQIRPEKIRTIPLEDFIREAWPVVEPSTPYQHSWHVDAICKHLEAVLEGKFRNLCINIPPRFTKSLIVSVFFPAWTWTFIPHLRFLFTSYAQSLAIRDSVRCRRVIESPWYQSHWGAMFRLTSDQNEKMRFENDKSGLRLIGSVGSAVTGEGGDIIVVDDPHNVQEATSTITRESVLRWWNESMYNRLDNPKTGRRIIIGQRVHYEDLSSHVVKSGEFIHLNLPNEYVPESRCVTPIWEDPRTEPDELLNPLRLGVDETASTKTTLGSYAYAAQYQQTPSPVEGGMFKKEWWKFYTVAPKFSFLCQSWDLNLKPSPQNTSSYVVGQVWGISGNKFYLVDQVRKRFSFTEAIRAILMMTSRYPIARLKLIEDTASGPAAIDVLRNRIVGLVPIEAKDSKPTRAAAIQPLVEAGNVYLPDKSIAPWVTDYVEEFAAATPDGGGLYWDQIDATSQALIRLSKKKHSLTWGKRGLTAEPRPVGSSMQRFWIN